LNKIKAYFKGYEGTPGDHTRGRATARPSYPGRGVEAEAVTGLLLGESVFISLRNGLRLPQFSPPFYYGLPGNPPFPYFQLQFFVKLPDLLPYLCLHQCC